MLVSVKIPDRIVNLILDCGYKKEDVSIIFSKFLDSVINHPYDQFYNDFEMWLGEEE
jgi:hypothetical protein